MTASLELDDDERLLAGTLMRFCSAERVLERAQEAQGSFDEALWRALCTQGVLELARPEGSLTLLVAAVEVLGRSALPGPLADTALALALATDDEAAPLLAGRALASVASPKRAPEAACATLFFELAPEGVFRLSAESRGVPVDGLAAEAWHTITLRREHRYEHAERALLVHDVVLAAQLASLAAGLVERTAQHAATRKQFGKPIGAFQAVSHPLASSHIALTAASLLARAAACAFEEDDTRARALATASLVSARRAALEAVYTCHQKLGGLGITLEGPAYHVGRRVRTLATRCTARITLTKQALLDGVMP